MRTTTFVGRLACIAAALASTSGGTHRAPAARHSVVGTAFRLETVGDGVEVRDRADPRAAVTFTLETLRGASGAVALDRPRVRADADRLVAQRGPIEEFYALGVRSAEQGFVLPSPIAARRGLVTLGLRVSGLSPRDDGGGRLALLDDAGRTRLTYGALQVTDADGRLLPSELRVDGGRVEVSFDDRTARYPVLVDPAVWAVSQELTAPQPSGGSEFGGAVAASGSWVVVGEPSYAGTAGSAQGQVHLFDQANGVFSHAGTLVPTMQRANTRFGTAVAVDVVGNRTRVVVGAPGSAGGTSSGRAFVFERIGTSPFTEVELTSALPGLAAGDGFGRSVAIEGDLVVVGADGLGSNQGGAEVFDHNGFDGYASVEALTNASDAVGARFGTAVAISGTTVVVGAPFSSSVATAFGRVDVYTTTNSTDWTLAHALPAVGSLSSTPAGAAFGGSLALSTTTLAIGAPTFEVGGSISAGRVYAFDATTFAPVAFVGSTAAYETFGTAVAMDGDTLLVGVPGLSAATGTVQRVERYVRVGGSLGTPETVGFDGVTSRDQFGRAAAIVSGANTPWIVGAPTRTVGIHSGAGAVEVVRLLGGVGDSCSLASDCALGHCVDGVCCNAACGGNSTSDCQACAGAGVTTAGMCTTLTTGVCAGGGDGGVTPVGPPFADPRALSCVAAPGRPTDATGPLAAWCVGVLACLRRGSRRRRRG